MIIEIHSPDGSLSRDTREEWARDTRSLLHRCLLPDLDVLLPKMAGSGAREIFHVVAFADEKGVAVLTKRIREQFQRLKQYKESGLTFATTYRLLPHVPSSVTAPIKDSAQQIAAQIEDLIQSERLSRVVPV